MSIAVLLVGYLMFLSNTAEARDRRLEQLAQEINQFNEKVFQEQAESKKASTTAMNNSNNNNNINNSGSVGSRRGGRGGGERGAFQPMPSSTSEKSMWVNMVLNQLWQTRLRAIISDKIQRTVQEYNNMKPVIGEGGGEGSSIGGSGVGVGGSGGIGGGGSGIDSSPFPPSPLASDSPSPLATPSSESLGSSERRGRGGGGGGGGSEMNSSTNSSMLSSLPLSKISERMTQNATSLLTHLPSLPSINEGSVNDSSGAGGSNIDNSRDYIHIVKLDLGTCSPQITGLFYYFFFFSFSIFFVFSFFFSFSSFFFFSNLFSQMFILKALIKIGSLHLFMCVQKNFWKEGSGIGARKGGKGGEREGQGRDLGELLGFIPRR